MTTEPLSEQLERLAGRATQGGWRHYNEVFRSKFGRRRVTEIQRASDGKAIVCWSGFDGLPSVTQKKINANAALVVALVNNLPAIIEALRAKEGE